MISILINRNRSPSLLIYGNLMSVSVYQCLIFVHLGLRRILVLCKQVTMDEDEVLVNAYKKPNTGKR